MSKAIVGRDVTAYSVQSMGVDTVLNSGAGGAVYNLLGRWKDIEIRLKKNWVERTPSGAEWTVKRRTTKEGTATLKNIVHDDARVALPMALGNDFIYVTFTDASTGQRMFFAGGIDEAGQNWGQDGSDEDLSLLTVGDWNGGDPIGFL